MRWILLLALSIAAAGQVGCASGRCCAGPAAANRPVDDGMAHIVLFTFKPGFTDTQMAQLVADCKAMIDIPGVKAIYVGPPNPSDRPVIRTDYDLGLVVIMDGPQTLAVYEPHPIHQKIVKDHLSSIASLVVYDIQ